ncbi:MAG: hypothetical protein HOO86_13470 [Bacteroidales bacterium]|nr:hypothetical protein [Bacteroidales bacterium]
MKTNADNQSLIPERTANNEKFDTKGHPKNPPSEDIFRKFQDNREANPEDFSKPIHSKSDTIGKNNREDIKNDITGLETTLPCCDFDEEQEAIRSEFVKNNPTG